MGNFDPIRQILVNVEQNPQWHGRQQLRRIRDHWPAIVGDAVARHTRPIALHDQQLRVATSTPTWSQNLMFERQRLLKKLNQYFQNPPLSPPITQLHFSPGRWSQTQPAPPRKKTRQKTREKPRKKIREKTTPAVPPRSPRLTPPPTPHHNTPQQAFQSWSQQVQKQREPYPPCPLCQIPTPPTELERWNCCAHCATQHWRT